MPRFFACLLAGSWLALCAAEPARYDPPDAAARQHDRARKEELLLRAGGNARSEAAVAAGLQWLAKHQAADGHWGMHDFATHGKCNCADPGRQYDVAGTAFALLPLLVAGYGHNDNLYAKHVERGLKYLLAQQRNDGHFGGIMAAHGLAAQAVCTAYGLIRDPQLRAPAQRAIDFICQAQCATGGWRYLPRAPSADTEQSGWQMQALRLAQVSGLDVPQATLDLARSWLDAHACDEDGATYGYVGSTNPSMNMSAVGLLCRYYLGWRPGYPGMKKGVATLLQHPPDPKVRRMYYYYSATQVLHHTGGPAWTTWNPRMRDLLIETQDQGTDADRPHQQGSWSSAGWDIGGYGGGRIMMTALALLTLEIYYSPDKSLGSLPLRPLQPHELHTHWNDLGAAHVLTARQGIWALGESPAQAVPFFAERLLPVSATVAPERLAQLITDLDDDRFAVRHRAEEELHKLADLAEPAMRKELASKPTVDVRRRIQRLVQELERQQSAPETMRALRAIQVLESTGTPEARLLLEKLAQGTAQARLTREARAVLERLGRKPGAGPDRR